MHAGFSLTYIIAILMAEAVAVSLRRESSQDMKVDSERRAGGAEYDGVSQSERKEARKGLHPTHPLKVFHEPKLC